MTFTAPSSRATANTERRRAAPALIVALLLGALLCASAAAKQSDRSQPVNVTARAADAAASPNGVSHLKGDVVITQGTLKITSDNGTIHFDAQSAVNRVVLTGSAHIQQMDDNGNLMTGNADRIDYDIPKGVAILTGHAHVKQPGRGSASGDKLVYNTTTSVMSAQSHGDNRVHLTFKPKQQVPAKDAAKPAVPASTSSAPAPAADGN
jgi:lipopolysaccharide export system protein LptA